MAGAKIIAGAAFYLAGLRWEGRFAGSSGEMFFQNDGEFLPCGDFCARSGVGAADVVGLSPLGKERAVGCDERGVRMIDVRRFGGDAVEFDQTDSFSAHQRGFVWAAQIEPAAVESLEGAGDPVNLRF